MGKLEEIKREIELRKAELENLELLEKISNRDLAIKDLSEFTVEDKVKWFDKTYQYVLNDLIELETKGYIDEDSDVYLSEEVRVILARDNKKYWKYSNSLHN